MPRLMIKTMWMFCVSLPLCVQAMTIQYFGLITQWPLQNTTPVTVCLLDKSELFQQAINDALRKQRAAHPMSEADIKARYATQFRVLSKNSVCQFEAAQLGVTQLPAMVINHQYVIYGQQNVDAGVKEYHAYLERDRVG